jgi:hypothetical protein
MQSGDRLWQLCPKDSARGSVEMDRPRGLTPMIAPLACEGRVSNSTRASALGPGSLSQFIKPSSACNRELRSAVDEAEELKTLAHISWHQARTVVAAGD